MGLGSGVAGYLACCPIGKQAESRAEEWGLLRVGPVVSLAVPQCSTAPNTMLLLVHVAGQSEGDHRNWRTQRGWDACSRGQGCLSPTPETIARSWACINTATHRWLSCYLFPLLSSGILIAGTQTDECSPAFTPQMCLTGHVRHCFGGPGPRQILACSTHSSSLPRRFLKLLKSYSKFYPPALVELNSTQNIGTQGWKVHWQE